MTPDVFTASEYYTGPPLSDELVRRAEAQLGCRLPASYLRLLRERNGGELRRGCFPTDFPTSWAEDHFEVTALLGIGGAWALDGEFGSPYMVAEWGYPEIGVAIGLTPSAGHDTVMLDYRACGPQGEPAVVHVDEDRVPRRVAESFDAFLSGLRDCPEPPP